MKGPHIEIPGDKTGVEIHGDYKKPVHEFPVPHLPLGNQVRDERRTDYAEEGPQNRPGYGDKNRLGQSPHLHDLDVVAQMNALGIEEDMPGRYQLVIADRVYEHIIKRKQAHNRKSREKGINKCIKKYIYKS
jgi:hypothetical protein